MKELLTAVQNEIRTHLPYVRDSDVKIVPHVNYIPYGARFPFIGLKDGPVKREELPGGGFRFFKRVHIVVYVKLLKGEASVMGDEPTGQKGVLDIPDDLHDVLNDNFLGLDGMHEAFCPDEKESEMFGNDKEGLQRKIITYAYEREVL